MKLSRRACLSALAVGGLAPTALAQATGQLPILIPRAILFGNPDKAGPQISPDGGRLAYLAPKNGVLNVWVRTLGKTDDKVITDDKKRGVRQYFWQPDSKQILYLQDEGGNENYRLYQTDLATGQTKDLTPFPNVQVRVIAVDPVFPDFILIGVNNRNPALHDVHKVDLKTGKLELIEENKEGYAGYVTDNKMEVRAAVKMLPDGSTEVYVRSTPRSAWRQFMRWGADESLGGPVGFSPDDDRLWLLSSLESNALRLLECSLSTGDTRILAEDSQYDVIGLMTHPTKRHLEAVAFVRAKTEWKIMDRSVGDDLSTLSKVRKGEIEIVSRDLADKTWIVQFTQDNGPVYWYAYDRTTKKARILFPNRPGLQAYTLSTMEPIEFKARDGMTIFGYLSFPVGLEPTNLPLILLVHGGPWARDNWGYNGMVQWLTNRGYAVLQINFRGSTGYGKKYLNAGDKEWAGKMHTDLLDGKAWAVKQGYADPARVAIMGGSYGGYATLVGLTFTPEEFTCGVDIVGPSNLNTLLASIPPYWGPIRGVFQKRMGSDEAFLSSRSPLFKADRITKPLLIGQGANDPRVKQAESDQIVDALRKANKPVQYIVFPDEGHGFARPENNLYFTAKAELFLLKYLKGRYEPMRDFPGTSGVDK